ncbi:MAG TPA: ATP-binding cassette domain-containing protein [Jatrophihabitans sp.]|nr:ATP-binding cassette domain-containing protein [Jatrophihabitans sp.]
MTSVAVQCVGLTHQYPGTPAPALADVNLTIDPGARVAVLGRSGSGKSTLVTLLAGLHRPSGGQILVGDTDLGAASERELLALRGEVLSMVVQNPGRNLLLYGTAEDNIRFAQRSAPRRLRASLPSPLSLLSRLGLGALAGRPVAKLSGGEQQRLSIAVGLARQPGLLLLDEPTSQLDTGSRDRVLDLLATVCASTGCTVIAVTHDPAVAEALGSSRTLVDGRLAA